MCSIFMPTMRKPFVSIVETMSPTANLATASGLMMARVRSIVFMMCGGSADRKVSCFSGRSADDRQQGLADRRQTLSHLDAGGFQRPDLFRGRSVAAGFADHDDGFRLCVAIEEFQRVYEVGADDRIAADADRLALPNAVLREL